ncbi:50S ribosomal protein L21 [Calditrichota bacterium LG25]
MYAVVEIAGKQFRVMPDQKIKVPLLHVEPGQKVDFDKVLFYTDDKGTPHIGAPIVEKMKVVAAVVEHGRDKKVIVFKKKRRKGYRLKKGHRQHYTVLHIEKIVKTRAARAKKAETKEGEGEAKEA